MLSFVPELLYNFKNKEINLFDDRIFGTLFHDKQL